VPGFPLYEVSDLGRVRSLPRSYTRTRHGKVSTVTTKPKFLGGWVKRAPDGSPDAVLVSLRRDGITVTDRLHRWVLLAFVGPCPHGLEGCHNDGNPLNNRRDNLRWDTRAANTADSVRHGTKTPPPYHPCGETHPRARLSNADVRAIRATTIGRGVKAQLARAYGVSQTSIHRIITGQQRA
jgi:hypothetical protein